jgi:hypothetical protein
MADYTLSSSGLGSMAQENQIDSDWTDLQPLITPDELKDLHLFGIPLVSAIRDPITSKPAVMTPPLIKKYINEAVMLAEEETKLAILPRQVLEKAAFDRAEYDSFGYFQLRQRPVASIQSLQVVPSNEMPVFDMPLDWIDMGLLHLGQINIIPLTIAVKSGAVVPITTTPGGAAFLSVFGNKSWISSFWEIKYTVGYINGNLPKRINHLIGIIAAMEVLSALAATYSRTQSQSLSMDGMSQSISSPGPQLFMQRLQELAEKRKWLVGKLQSRHNSKIFISNI